jgi:hypothetical protein
LFDGFEDPDREQVLLERADEPLDTAVSFRGAHDLSQLQAGRNGGCEPTEMTLHTLPDRLQRLEPGRCADQHDTPATLNGDDRDA